MPINKELAVLNRAIKRLDKAKAAVCEAAMEYARVETIRYSKTLPKRQVQFVCAMGATSLHVQTGRLSWKKEYLITVDDHGDDVPVPAFLKVLSDAEYESGIPCLASNLSLTCKAGKIIKELTDW